MTIAIRKVQVTDFQAISDIYGDAVLNTTATYETVPPTPQMMMSQWYELRAKNLPYLVAVEDKKVIGFTYAAPFRLRPAFRYGVENALYVHPDHKGKGAGRALLDTLIETCKDQGFYNLYAVIGDRDNAASLNLHKSLGFTETGTLPAAGYKRDRWLDIIFLSKALRPHDSAPEGNGWG
ncbi:MAG: GNAT family N-acetyltransferase [Asticcacaulis sp.]